MTCISYRRAATTRRSYHVDPDILSFLNPGPPHQQKTAGLPKKPGRAFYINLAKPDYLPQPQLLHPPPQLLQPLLQPPQLEPPQPPQETSTCFWTMWQTFTSISFETL
jgi:hypothetical protein